MDTHTNALLLLIVQFITQVKINGFSAWVIQNAKTSQASWLKWINVNTPWVTRSIGFLAAALTAVGIHWTFAGGVLTITGISFTTIMSAIWNVAQNYLVQHSFYKAVFKD